MGCTYNFKFQKMNELKVFKPHRQVNIELLRIFSMLMVLVIHYNVATNGQTTHEMVMAEPLKAVGIASLKSLSFICVNCFIIISGYFGIRWKWKSLCNYLFQIAFWGGYDTPSGCGFRLLGVLHQAVA